MLIVKNFPLSSDLEYNEEEKTYVLPPWAIAPLLSPFINPPLHILFYFSDIVEKSTVVKAEGDPVEEIQSGIICGNDLKQPNQTGWNIKMSSADYVPDSISCQVRVSGDLLGSAIAVKFDMQIFAEIMIHFRVLKT